MKKLNLLVVEDDENIAALMCLVARETGFTVGVSGKGDRFESKYLEFQPDVIVLDILMPEMDGFEVLRYLGKKKCKSSIVITSGEKNYLEMAKKQGTGFGLCMAATITKPFRIPKLREVFARIYDEYYTQSANTGEDAA